MTEAEWLKSLGVGDAVIINAHGLSLAKVTHTTPTQVHVGGSKFRRADGRRISSDSWHLTYLQPPTPERIAHIDRVRLIDRLRATRWSEVPVDVLAAVEAAMLSHWLKQ